MAEGCGAAPACLRCALPIRASASIVSGVAGRDAWRGKDVFWWNAIDFLCHFSSAYVTRQRRRPGCVCFLCGGPLGPVLVILSSAYSQCAKKKGDYYYDRGGGGKRGQRSSAAGYSSSGSPMKHGGSGGSNVQKTAI